MLSFNCRTFATFTFPVLSACTGSVVGESKVNVRIVHDQPLLSSSLKTQSAGDTVTGLSDEFCYALMVSSSDGNAQLDRGEISEEDDNTAPGCEYNPRSLGKVRGLYKVGDNAEISVPIGDSREFYLFGVLKTALMKSCSATLTIDPNADGGESNVDAKIDGTVVDKFKPRLMAYAKANVGRTATSVDMRMVSDAAGLDIDKCGNDKLETTPSLFSFGNGTPLKLNLSNGTIQPFIKVHCPSTATKASVGVLGAAAAMTMSCVGDPVFILPPAVTHWDLKLYDANGQQVTFKHESYDQTGEGPDRSIVFEVQGPAARSAPFAVLTDGTTPPPICTLTYDKNCRLTFADKHQVVLAIENASNDTILASYALSNFDSNSTLPTLSTFFAQRDLPNTGIFNVSSMIQGLDGPIIPFSMSAPVGLSYLPISADLNRNIVPSPISLPTSANETKRLDNLIISAGGSSVTIFDISDTTGSSAKTLNFPDTTAADNFDGSLSVSSDLVTGRYHIVRRLSTGEFNISECTSGSKCIYQTDIPEKTALLSFDNIPSSAFTTYQDLEGHDRFLMITSPTSSDTLNNNATQTLDMPLSAFHYLAGALPSTYTDLLNFNQPFAEDFSGQKSARSNKVYTAPLPASTDSRKFRFIVQLKNSENRKGDFIAGGFVITSGVSQAFVLRSPDWGKTWFEIYRSTTNDTQMVQAVEIPLPGNASGNDQSAFLLLEKRFGTYTRLLLQQGGDGF